MDQMQVVIIDGDDWMGLYIDGELKLQGHRLPVAEVISAITGSKPEHVEPDPDWMYEAGQLPDKLSEVETG